ncbi:hypothetical protein GCM10022226_78760 [Sphaerisporangium flaviroseum]|uniref:Uncharacterized protein n=1 Tax=Sphaerisporangium flaviroseum TaxID=509199 RepID=A0ABP7JFQ2_9ACTN
MTGEAPWPAWDPPSILDVPRRTRKIAEELTAELARCNVPANRYGLPDGTAAVSLWRHVVAFTDGRRIWWDSLRLSAKGRPLFSHARTPEGAARLLLPLYLHARRRWPAESLDAPKNPKSPNPPQASQGGKAAPVNPEELPG